MSIWEVVVIGVGLAMDAFAASLVRGLDMKKFMVKEAFCVCNFWRISGRNAAARMAAGEQYEALY